MNVRTGLIVFSAFFAFSLSHASGFFDDVESGDNGWIVVANGGSSSLWHRTTAKSFSPTHSWWCGSEGSGNYDFGTIDNELISPSFLLPPGPSTLSFREQYSTESGWDDCQVWISTNSGVTWISLRQGAWGNSGGWVSESLDLSVYAGQSVQVRFRFFTGDGFANGFEGWFVDDVAVVEPATVSGTVRCSGVLIPGVSVLLIRADDFSVVAEEQTLLNGTYNFDNVIPGDYYLRTVSEGCADEYFDDVNQRPAATVLVVAGGADLTADFNLDGGQSPALANITSDPSGAEIFLDYTSTGMVTPALIDVGYVKPASSTLVVASHSLKIASHTIYVQAAGSPRPSPVVLNAIEAETVHHHFDLTDTNRASVQVESTPSSIPVFLDQTDVSVGVTPLTVTNLLPGSHTIFLDPRSVSTTYLQPRPIHVDAASATLTIINHPIHTGITSTGLTVEAISGTTNSAVYLDYLDSGLTTDASADWLDAASHAGANWYSASHTLQLRKVGYPASPIYYVCDGIATQKFMATLPVDQDVIVDNDGDGLPDDWEIDHDLDPSDNGSGDINNGPDGDKDGDGYTNQEELDVGTNPNDPNSTIDVESFDTITPVENSLTFATVPGRRYLVQCADDLSTGPWVNISSVITASGSTIVVPVNTSPGIPSRYYRIVALP